MFVKDKFHSFYILRGTTSLQGNPRDNGSYREITTNVIPMNWQHPKNQNKRVMVVENDTEIAWLVKEMLATRGHVIEIVPDEESCLKRFSSFRPDIILFSPSLSGNAGWEMLEWIRKQGLLHQTHVAILTTNPFIREDLARRGLVDKVDYIRKPFTAGDLIQKVEAAC